MIYYNVMKQNKILHIVQNLLLDEMSELFYEIVICAKESERRKLLLEYTEKLVENAIYLEGINARNSLD